ncbi:MAG: Ig-like domain-containing protein [Nitrosarchaeum sp.]|uniref:Ig-like domain-containing protein n=1 Tax=Nitrosarchaeum sp. TaxID=2026886 RepID=UPI002DE23F68|nr:Ig-like domain-containing protein [Nitrosarchaeum sp.]
MKFAIIISITLVLGLFTPVHAQTYYEFGYQFHPQKLLENTEGIIHVYVLNGGEISPTIINGLKVSSSDNSILEVKDTVKTENFATQIKIFAKQPGTVNLSLAAPGVKSKEIPITVYTNNNHPTKLLLKTTPNEFPVDGPKFGYIGIELVTTGDLPTIATEDTIIKISTPNTDIIKLQDSEVIIPKGEYYAVTKFNISESGDAIIFAESEGMKKVNDFIHVRKAATPLQLQLYVYPENFNSFSSQIGYAIIQLQDADGIPVKADKKINLRIGVENPDSGLNTSHDFEEFLFESKELIIDKGHYSTFSSFSIRPNLSNFAGEFEQTYNLFITADNYFAKGSSVKITHDQIGSIEGKGPAITKTVPFLTTGEKEILGVTYFETEVEVSRQTGTKTLGSTDRETVIVKIPVMASEDFSVNIASSNLETVDPEDTLIKKGKNAGLIFGDTGTVIPDEGTSLELYITDNKQVVSISGEPYGPVEEDLSLVVEPLIAKILSSSDFPLIGYLIELESDNEETVTTTEEDEEEDGRIGVTHFIKNSVLTFSANELFEIPYQTILQNQEYSVFTAHANKLGSSSLKAQAMGLDSEIALESMTTDPTLIELSFAENILPMTKNIASVQLLDSAGNPVYAKNQMELKIVSNNEKSLKLPETILIDKGEYYKLFLIDAITEGSTEVTILAENLPMTNFQLNVKGFHPEISLNTPNAITQGDSLIAEMIVKYAQSDLPVESFDVTWNVNGGEIIDSDALTDSNGKAQIKIDNINSDKLEIFVTVNGLGFTDLKTQKIMTATPNLSNNLPTSNASKFDLVSENNLMLFAIPSAAGAAFFYLRKTNRLEEISERLNIVERFENIRDRVSEIRDR